MSTLCKDIENLASASNVATFVKCVNNNDGWLNYSLVRVMGKKSEKEILELIFWTRSGAAARFGVANDLDESLSPLRIVLSEMVRNGAEEVRRVPGRLLCRLEAVH